MTTPAVVLLSGGLDSATTLAIARAEGHAVHALSFRYGQRHAIELTAAAQVARHLGAQRHVVAEIDLRAFGGSALTDTIAVPKGRSAGAMATAIPITYVPARNTIFLAHALGWAEVIGAGSIYIGVNALDYSGYPDCRPEFIAAFERLANLATRSATELGRPLTIRAPLVDLTKAEIIRRGMALGVDFGMTRSCYDPDPDGRGCGGCDSCQLRLKGFREVGMEDPAPYVQKREGEARSQKPDLRRET
jgi:7-cyano-7-deazaguanine synthase